MSILRRCRWRTLASRGTRPTARSRGRRGLSSVMMIIALPALLGVAALAIDLGVMTLTAERVSNVADAAALAGARSFTDEATAVSAAQTVTAANNTTSYWQVTPEVRCYGPGQTVSGYGMLGESEHVVEVVGHARFDFLFGRALGLTSTEVYRRAAARVLIWTSGVGEAFIFAGCTDPNVNALTMIGGGNTICGPVHSNAGLWFEGKDNTVDGNVEYGSVATINGQNFVCTGECAQVAPIDYLVDYTWDQFASNPAIQFDYDVPSMSVLAQASIVPSGHWRVRGDVTIGGNGTVCRNTLIVADGNIDLQASDLYFDKVTLVAKGWIRINGARGFFSPYLDNLFALSLADTNPYDTGTKAILFNAADCEATGFIYAPDGRIEFQGSREQTYHVGIIGETVDLVGTGCTHGGPGAGEDNADVTSGIRLII